MRPRQQDPEIERKKELEAELRALYQEVDAMHSDWSCPKSTDCCHFGRTGREPYVTGLELALVEKARAALGAKKSKKLLPMAERRCPLLGEGGGCTVYASRPFGCRTFYCDDADRGSPVTHKTIVALVARLKALSAEYQAGGDQGRPLTRAL